MMKNKVAVVIPNWNGADLISKCLASLEKQSIESSIIVVDNGSTDDSVGIIKHKFPKVKLLEFNDNAGFAGGVNRGIKYAIQEDYDFIALFNSDAVAEKNWLAELSKELRSNEAIGIVTGKLMRSDKIHLDSTGDFYTIWGLPYPRGRNQIDTGQYDKAEEVFSASGGASLYRVKLFRDIGLFDEDFFAYYEDVDISFRAQMAGWKIMYTPKAVAYHAVGGTSSKMGDFTRYHSAKNFVLLYFRNMPTGLLIKYLPLYLLQYGRLLIGAIAHRKLYVFIKGSLTSLRLVGDTFKIRQANSKKKQISNQDIDNILVKSRPPKISTI